MWVDIIEETGTERRAGGGVVGVEGDKVGNLGAGRVLEKVSMDVIDELIGGCDVGLGEREECAFVFLVADDERDISVFSIFDEGVN